MQGGGNRRNNGYSDENYDYIIRGEEVSWWGEGGGGEEKWSLGGIWGYFFGLFGGVESCLNAV